MKKLFVLMLAFAFLACAEENHGPVQKVIPVKTGDAMQIFQTVRDVLAGTHINVKLYENNIVVNGTPEMVDAAEQLVKNLESSSPPRDRDVEITGDIILASVQAGNAGTPIPGDLEPVVKQFRNLLNYKSFRVLDTIILRSKENSEANSNGLLALPDSAGATVRFHIDRAIVNDNVVHLKRLLLLVGVPTTLTPGQTQNRELTIGTDVDVKAGQKVAIGKASVDTNGDALILVISAKVVD